MFSVNRKGFAVTFQNGYEVSVAFGVGNYCSNKSELKRGFNSVICENAEIMVFKAGTNMPVNISEIIDNGKLSSDGLTFGWALPNEFAELLAKISALPQI